MRASQEANSYSAMGIDQDRRRRLEALPGWSWDVAGAKWEVRFGQLKEFLKREGHSQVPHTYKTDDGVPLGLWVGRQKQRFVRGVLEPARQQRLDALPGWAWPRQSIEWEEGFGLLKQFSDREGHCNVPDGYKTHSDYPLGAWLRIQRKRAKNPDHRRRLEALPDWSWESVDRFEEQWEEGFANLAYFSEREGHTLVPKSYKTDGGYNLYAWVRRQRQRKADGTFISLDRQQRLESLSGWTWTPESDRHKALWEKRFVNLKQFSDREGHSQVPSTCMTDDGSRLNVWVNRQRTLGETLIPDRRERLESLPGWVWKK
jgi:hypothetical protein